MVYVLLLQRIERWVMIGQLTSIIAATAGAKVEPPDLWARHAELDAWLVSPLDGGADRPTEQRELEAALGVG